MHQDHNIPWKTLATHLTITEGVHPAFSTRPRPLNFYPRDRQDQGKTFTYFSNAIIKSIQDFATTERQKYPSKLPIKKTEDLFSDELIQRCHAKYDGYYNHRKYYPNEDNQKLEHWCSRVKPANPSGWLCSLGPHYDARDIDLADTIKVLVIENEMVPVLQLASHPSVPLMTLYRLCSPNRGWNQLAKYTIQVYIYLNILAEFPEYCENRKYQSLYSYWPLMDKATHYDSPVAIFTHSYLDPLDEEGHWHPQGCRARSTQDFDIFGDLKRLKEYLKACFEVLYRCEMMVRECGTSIPWDNFVHDALYRFNVQSRCHWVPAIGTREGGQAPRDGEGEGKWMTTYV